MTSVVDTSVKHFHSAMVGAPVLSGTAGAMAALLDACLVNGFDVKAGTSLVVASGIATLSFGGTHSAAVDSVILISGVTGALTALNGEQKITAIGAGFVKFATAAADGTAAGSVSFKMAPIGMLSPFTGTNVRTYKSADPAGTGMILRVDDTATTSCRVVGYEQMTDINTGTGPFPTAAQMAGGGYWSKSNAANATAAPWLLIGDGRSFILHVAAYVPSNAASVGGFTRGFGDFAALRPGGDPYACALSYSTNTTVTSQSDGTLDGVNSGTIAMPRAYTGLGSAAMHNTAPFTGASNVVSGMDPTLGSFPGAVDGSLWQARKFFSSGSAPRGILCGLLHVPMSQVFNTFKTRDVIPGTGPTAGRKLMALNPANSIGGTSSSEIGVSFVDITGPWR